MIFKETVETVMTATYKKLNQTGCSTTFPIDREQFNNMVTANA